MKHSFLVLCAAALAATACTNDELGNGTPPQGARPIVINASGLQAVATPASTRATVDGNWDGVTSVALSVGGMVKEYSVTTTDPEEEDRHALTRERPVLVDEPRGHHCQRMVALQR